MPNKKTVGRRFSFLPAFLAIALLTLIALPCHAQPFQPVPDRAESFTRPASAGDEASPFKPRRTGVSPPAHSIRLGPVSRERISAEAGAPRRPGTPHKIGFGRDVSELRGAADTAARLQWQPVPQGGRIAAISITSPQATGIRFGILVRSLQPEAVLRFYPQGAGDAHEVSGREVLDSVKRNLDAGDSSDEARTYWSPHIEGEEATLEIELPADIDPDALEIAIPRVSHFFESPLTAKEEFVTKAAAICEVDISCHTAWSPESNATAKMTFVKSGSSFLCTGTLLNDTASSGTPHFLGANHCISTQTVASTLQTFWFYRSRSCNSTLVDTAYRTLLGGATLVYAGATTDTSFMRLQRPPPSGANFAGWFAGPPPLGTSVAGVHHPVGDLQKISFGSVQSFLDCTVPDPITGSFSCFEASQANGEFLGIVFASGATEAGSSGSGLFMSTGSSHLLIGQLRGGNSSCSNPSGKDDYGRFDLAYAAELHKWLSPVIVHLEEPVGGGTGSGVANVRGWAVSSRPIVRVDLYLDGNFLSTVPYGGTRKDVGAAYPNHAGSENSGFSMAFNFGNLSAGSHTVVARAVNDLGNSRDSAATFNVVRFPSSFISNPGQVSVLAASLTILDGNTFRLGNVVVQDVAYDLTLRWNTAAQGFPIVALGAGSNVASMAAQVSEIRAESVPGSGDIIAHLEEPVGGSNASGIANIRGWAVSLRPIVRVDLYLDGSFLSTVPYGGTRNDVAAAYPGYPGSENSGYSMAFNFGNLNAGSHTLIARAVDDTGDYRDSAATFNVARFPSSFIPDPNQVSVLGAGLQILDSNTFRVSNVLVQNAAYDLTLRWNTAAQAFTLVGIQ